LLLTSEAEKVLEAKAKSSASASLQIYHDQEVDLNDYIARAEHLPKVPIAPTFSVHWLAVGGLFAFDLS
jgi:hypothetical protein